MHPLDGAQLKVVRANKHLKTLNDEIAIYLSTNPYEFPLKDDGDVVTATSAIVKNEPPLELGCIVGDCLGNLRKSLDYIAWQLAVRYAATAPIVSKDKIYFPVVKDLAAFNKNGRSNLIKYSIPTDAIDIIESVQPYHAGNESLGILNSLGNEDKHCLPLLAIAQADTASVTVSVTGPPVPQLVMNAAAGSKMIVTGFNSVGMNIRRLTPEDLKDPNYNPFIGLPNWPPTPTTGEMPTPSASEQLPRNIKVYGQVTIFVSLKNSLMPPEPVDRTLEQIIKRIADIIPRFDRFFV